MPETQPPTITQIAIGSAIAQAAAGGTAIVNAYQYVPPQPITADRLAAAAAQLAALPRDRVPGQVAPLPAGSRVPFRPNPFFVGRDADLLALARGLTHDGSAAIGQIAAATGLGGIGKTQLAIEFAHRYGQYFAGGVFWLNFAEPAGVAAEVAACGRLGLVDWRPDYAQLKLDEQVSLVQSAWTSALPRLLIFDNCESETLLMQWHPTSGGCRVLLTSRRATWEPTLGVTALALDVLPRPESVALLRQFRPDLPATDPDLAALAAAVGDLPLALHMAGSFLKQYQAQTTPAAYVAELQGAAVLAHESLQGIDLTSSPTNHVLHIGRTFALSYERLNQADPIDALALKLLVRATQFAPGIPIAQPLLLATVPQPDPAGIRQAVRALRRLRDLGLLTENASETSTLHRLVARFVMATATDPAALLDVAQAVLARADELNAQAAPAALLALQPHLRAVTEARQSANDALSAALCNALGDHLRMVAAYPEAKPYLERALAIRQKVLGPDHADTAQSLQNLGDLLEAQGAYAKAAPLIKRALAIRQRVLGAGHPVTAQSLHSLAEIEQELDSPPESRPRPARRPPRTSTLPAPTGAPPYHLSLDAVLPMDRTAAIRSAEKIALHMVGNTGGVRQPEHQLRVAQAMVGQFDDPDATTHPAFFYHLGDVVFYEGSPREYLAQFYRPYSDYPGPIMAIPGNHDRLPAFINNFCAASPRITPSAGETARKAMIQPNVYWTLEAPFVTIIGLYSGVEDSGQLDAQQIRWFANELRTAPADKALLVAVHHPAYSAGRQYGGSPHIQKTLEAAFERSGRVADAVLAAHTMNYQRFTRTVGDRQVPYLITGAGGYYHLHRLAQQAEGSSLTTPLRMSGTDVTLESYCDDSFGFMRLTITPKSLSGEYFVVARPQPLSPAQVQRRDSFALDLQKHRLIRSS